MERSSSLSDNLFFIVGMKGLEPLAFTVSGCCSTVELHSNLVAGLRLALRALAYEANGLLFTATPQCELNSGLEPDSPVYKTGASPLMLVQLLQAV